MDDSKSCTMSEKAPTLGPLTLQIKSLCDAPSSSSLQKETIYSPVTDLALNFSEHLTTRNPSFSDTPKRKLSLSLLGDTPTPVRPSSFRSQLCRTPSIDQGCFVDTPSPSPSEESAGSPVDSPSCFGVNLRKSQEHSASPKSRVRKSAFRRFKSLPNGCLSQSFPPNERPTSPRVSFSIGQTELSGSQDSQDSGIGKDEEESSKEDFKFVAPVGLPPRSTSRSFMMDELSCSPFQYSPVKDRCTSAPAGTLDFSPSKAVEATTGSPVTLGTSSLTSSMNDEDFDDGFLDTHFMDDHDLKHGNRSMPSGISDLLTAPLVNNENAEPTKHSVTRGLFRSPSVPDFRLRRPSAFKRPDRPLVSSPQQIKRRKSMIEGKDMKLSPTDEVSVLREVDPQVSSFRRFHRCHSASEAMIKSVLNKDASEQNLAGDYTSTFCLPTITGRHQDLKSITPETVCALIKGEYSHMIEKFIIIDCRYPYEFNGGHIQGARNIYSKDHAIAEFFKDPSRHATSQGKRCVLIFHCEFSSERAPKLSRFMRNHDREVNTYPALHYPEMYLLHNGYKNFFECQKEYCEPQTYKPMVHKDHADDLKHFRAKSKSWAGDCKGRYGYRTGLKF